MSHRASSNISPLSLSRYWFPLTTCFLESPRDNFSLGDTKCAVVVLRIEACLALPDGSEVFWVMIKLAPGFLVQMNEVHCRRKADNYYRQANTLRQATTMPADGGKLEGIWSIKTWSQARSHPSNPTECRDTEDFLFPDTTSKTINWSLTGREHVTIVLLTSGLMHTQALSFSVSRLGVISPRLSITLSRSHVWHITHHNQETWHQDILWHPI